MSNSAHRALHVAHIGFFNDPQRRRPLQLLDAWPTLVDVAEAASGAGIRVSVLQACAHSEALERNGVRYHFLPFSEPPGSAEPQALGTLLRTLEPDVLHVHGLDFAHQCRWLSTHIVKPPLILQDHASRLPPIWRRARW